MRKCFALVACIVSALLSAVATRTNWEVKQSNLEFHAAYSYVCVHRLQLTDELVSEAIPSDIVPTDKSSASARVLVWRYVFEMIGHQLHPSVVLSEQLISIKSRNVPQQRT